MKNKKLKEVRENNSKINYFEDLPNEVLYVKAMAMIGQSISTDTYEKAITNYPEYFPEETQYREKWSKVPKHLKDEYFSSTTNIFLLSHDALEEQERLFGKCPHPDLNRCGIIQRVTTHCDRGEDFIELDEWNRKWFKHQHIKDVDLYNKLFNAYGLSKTYDD